MKKKIQKSDYSGKKKYINTDINLKKRPENYLKRKVCEKCTVVRKNDTLIFCEVCDDSYHPSCIKDSSKKRITKTSTDQILCSWCKRKAKDLGILGSSLSKAKQRKLNDYFELKGKKNHVINCSKCKSKILESLESKCIRCKKSYHSKCFSNSESSIICTACESFVKRSVSQKSGKIEQYFKQIFSKEDDKLMKISSSTKRKPSFSFNFKKKKNKQPKFKLYSMDRDSVNRKIQIKSLLFALKAKGINFEDNLYYKTEELKNANNAELEPDLQKIDSQNFEVYKRFKEYSKEGIYPPVEVIQDKIQGFIVKALEDIPSLTLICEYVGEVDFTRNRLYDNGDSIMDLLTTGRSATSLVIVPDKFGNLARFLSGVNNHDKKKKSKQNVN